MKALTFKIKKAWMILLAAAILGLTGCAGAHMGMSYGVSIGGGPGGATVPPHFNVGVYGGGRVW